MSIQKTSSVKHLKHPYLYRNKLFQTLAKVSKGNFRRHLSYRLQRLFQKLHKYPSDIVIETASVCNLNCTICRSVKADLGRKNRFMSFDLFKKIVDDIAPICNTIGVSYCGEPLLNKDIFKMVRYASDKGMCVSMLTNGVLLNAEARKGVLDSGLHFMAISMDGAVHSLVTTEELRQRAVVHGWLYGYDLGAETHQSNNFPLLSGILDCGNK